MTSSGSRGVRRRFGGGVVSAVLLCVLGLLGAGQATASVTPLPTLPPTPITTPLSQALARVVTFLDTYCSSASVTLQPALAPLCEAAAQQAGTDAYIYGIAPMEFIRQQEKQTSVTVPNQLSDAPLNQFGSARYLATATPGAQVFVQPNNDTLYSMAHLNLATQPLVLAVPAVPNHRYYVLQFLDPYTNVFHYVGTRTTGDGAGRYLIAGPQWRGVVPRGLRLIRSSYNLAWIAGRTLVYGPGDLTEVHRIQQGYKLVPLSAYQRVGLSWTPPRPSVIRTQHRNVEEPAGLPFFDKLGDVLKASPPPAADEPVLKELRSVGIGPGLHPSTEALSAPIRAGLAAAADGGHDYVSNARTTFAAESAVQHHGWFVPYADTGAFGTDYLWRAMVAIFGLAANRPVEAVYTIGVTDQYLQKLDGSHSYVIHFAASALPPARYFWSLTMYDANFYLVPNALGRYALGNRSPSLVYNPDGSLDLYLSHTEPAGHAGNWLPAPASGNFEVTLRMYGPSASVLNDTYAYPSIQRVG